MADNNAKINKLLGERGSFNEYTKVSSIDEATELWNKLKSQNSFNKDQIKIIDENIERLNTARRKIANYGQKCEPYIKDPVTQVKFNELRGEDRQYKKASIATLRDLTNGEVKAPMSLTFDGRKLSSNLADLGGLEYTSFLKNSLTLAAACTLFTPALSGLASYFAEGSWIGGGLNYLAGGSGAFLSKVLGSFLPEVLGGVLGTLTSVLNPATAGIALVVGVGSLAFLARKVLGPEIKKFKDKSKVKSLARDLFAKEFGKEDAKESYAKSQKFKKDSSKNFEKELLGLCKNGVPAQKDIDALKAKYISIGASEEELNNILKDYVGDPQRSQNDMGKYFSKDDKGNYNYKADIKGYLVAHPDVFKRYNKVVDDYKIAISTICNTSKLPTDKGTALRNLETSCKDLFPGGLSLPVELELQTLCNGLHTVASNLYSQYATSSSLNGKKEADIKKEVEDAYQINDGKLDTFQSDVQSAITSKERAVSPLFTNLKNKINTLEELKNNFNTYEGAIRRTLASYNAIINDKLSEHFDFATSIKGTYQLADAAKFDNKQLDYIEFYINSLRGKALSTSQQKILADAEDALADAQSARNSCMNVVNDFESYDDKKNQKLPEKLKETRNQAKSDVTTEIEARNEAIENVSKYIKDFLEEYILQKDPKLKEHMKKTLRSHIENMGKDNNTSSILKEISSSALAYIDGLIGYVDGKSITEASKENLQEARKSASNSTTYRNKDGEVVSFEEFIQEQLS